MRRYHSCSLQLDERVITRIAQSSTMFRCCAYVPVVEDKKPLIVDLNKFLCDRAWRLYRSTWGICAKLSVKREEFDIEVPENFFEFEHLSQDVEHKKEIELRLPGAKGPPPSNSDITEGQGSTDTSGLLKGKVPSNRSLTNPEIVSLDTVFRNETAERQLYKFRFEKTRKTEIEVTFQKGFTMGGKANFSIGPIGVDAEMQYQVTKSDGQKFEETMLMEATSDIAVGPNSCYTANVQLEEKPIHATFKVVTRMSMPQGRAPVYITRKSNKERVFTYYIQNLPDIFGYGQVSCANEVPDCDDKIDFVIEGVIKGYLACHHNISLTSDETDEAKNSAKVQYIKVLPEQNGALRKRENEDR